MELPRVACHPPNASGTTNGIAVTGLAGTVAGRGAGCQRRHRVHRRPAGRGRRRRRVPYGDYHRRPARPGGRRDCRGRRGDRKSVVEGKSVELGGGRIIKKKIKEEGLVVLSYGVELHGYVIFYVVVLV